MSKNLINLVVFLSGLAVVCWVGADYAGANILALSVTIVIGAFYLGGAFELHRYRQATSSLFQATARPAQAPADLAAWLDGLHPSLRNPVRLRIEGQRVALPGPALTPYLVGLLVLLGMLGTFLGMVATLRGTGLALESATDLQAIRASLAAPVKGLGFAFGTSIAGVATSAMLGLLSALCRRERLQSAQALEVCIATTLRPHSANHQREETFRLLQRQAETTPLLVDRLRDMMSAMEKHNQALHERLARTQDAFYGRTEATYSALAIAMEQALERGVAASASAAGAAIQPAVQATMAALARDTAAWHDTVTQAVQQQLDGLTSRFDASTANVAQIWTAALSTHERTSATLTHELRDSLGQFTTAFEQRFTALVDKVSAQTTTLADHFSAQSASLAQSFTTRAAALTDDLSTRSMSLAERISAHSGSLAETLAAQSAALVQDLSRQSAALVQEVSAQSASLAGNMSNSTALLLDSVSDRSTRLLDGVSARSTQLLDGMSERSADLLQGMSGRMESASRKLSDGWQEALARHESASQKAAGDNQRALTEAAAAFAQHSASLLGTLDRSHTRLQQEIAANDERRLATWTESLGTMAASLGAQWEQAGVQNADTQRTICETLTRTARDLSAQAEAHAAHNIAEISRLMRSAAEAPQAAAAVIAELRDKLSDSMARDNAMLEERNRLLETLGTLLDAVNHAANGQRTAVDELVSTSAELLGRIGSQFTARAEQETERLSQVSAQVAGGAAEVASMGEAFGMAVQLFSASNDKLVSHLERIEAALDKSVARSDDQLAYYVAQAREVVDLSMISQKQILEELQRQASLPAAAGTEAA